jgi:acid phosphatase type 7
MNTKKNKTIFIIFLFLVITELAYAQSDIRIFAVYGDSRTNHSIHWTIADLIVNARPEAVFHTGDMVDTGSDQNDWAVFNEITAGIRENTEFWPAIGNHDNDPVLFFRNFPYLKNNRWYSVERAGVHFAILDSCSSMEPGSPQYDWLETDLKSRGKQNSFTAVVLHHPVYSSGQHPENPRLVRDLVPLLEKYRVDVVFSGHDHNYERLYRNNVYYIVTGGGGARLRERARTNPYSQVFRKTNHFCLISVSRKEMKIDVYDIDSRLIDSFKITR